MDTTHTKSGGEDDGEARSSTHALSSCDRGANSDPKRVYLEAPDDAKPASGPSTTITTTSSSSRTKRKRSRYGCHDWVRNGQCSFGDECKYVHTWEAVLGGEANIVAMLEQMAWRQSQPSLSLSSPSSAELPPPFTASFASMPGRSDTAYIHAHPNAVVAIGLGELHPARQFLACLSREDAARTRVRVTLNRQVLPTGSKKQAKEFAVGTLLAEMVVVRTKLCDAAAEEEEAETKQAWEFRAPLPGTLLEFNERWTTEDFFFGRNRMESEGFIALVKVTGTVQLALPRVFVQRNVVQNGVALVLDANDPSFSILETSDG